MGAPADTPGFQTQTVPIVPAAGGAPAFDTGEQEQGIAPSKWSKFVGLVKETSDNTGFGFYPGYAGPWSRAILQDAVQKNSEDTGSLKLTPQQANEQYPGMPVPFKEDVFPEIARMQWADHQKRQKLAEWVARGPETGWFFGLAAGATSAFDPANIALNVATAGASKIVGAAATFRNLLLQNAAMNTALAIPSYFQKEKEGQVVSVGEEAQNVAAGSLLGAGIGKLLHTAMDYASRAPERVNEQNVRTAVAQREAGAPVSLDPQTGQQALRVAGAVQPGTVENPYVFRPLEHPSENTHYVASSAENGAAVPLSDLGPGTYATDNGQVANNLASSPESPYTGRVHEVAVDPNAKFLNLDEPVGGKEAGAFVKSVEEKLGVKINLAPEVTLREAVQEIALGADLHGNKSQVLSEIQGFAKERGFDGYKYVETHGGDSRSNNVVLFDDNKLSPGEQYEANKDITPRMTPAESQMQLDQAGTPARSSLAYPEIDERLTELKARPIPDAKVMDPLIAHQEQQANQILKNSPTQDAHLEAEMRALDHEKALAAQEISTAKALMECFVKGIT